MAQLLLLGFGWYAERRTGEIMKRNQGLFFLLCFAYSLGFAQDDLFDAEFSNLVKVSVQPRQSYHDVRFGLANEVLCFLRGHRYITLAPNISREDWFKLSLKTSGARLADLLFAGGDTPSSYYERLAEIDKTYDNGGALSWQRLIDWLIFDYDRNGSLEFPLDDFLNILPPLPFLEGSARRTSLLGDIKARTCSLLQLDMRTNVRIPYRANATNLRRFENGSATPYAPDALTPSSTVVGDLLIDSAWIPRSLRRGGDSFILREFTGTGYETTYVLKNGTIRGHLKTRVDVLDALGEFDESCPQGRCTTPREVTDHLREQWRIVDHKSPPPDPAEKIIWKTVRAGGGGAYPQEAQDRFNVIPRRYLGFTDDVREKIGIGNLLQTKCAIPHSWLAVIAVGEGWDFSQYATGGFGSFGLDIFGDEVAHLKAEGYLRRDFSEYTPLRECQEGNKMVNTAKFKDNRAALEAFCATLSRRKALFLRYAKNQGREASSFTPEQSFFFTYLFFNAGEERAKELIQENAVVRQAFLENHLPRWEGDAPENNLNATFNALERLSTWYVTEKSGIWD